MNNDHIISTLNKELDELESKIETLSNKYLDLKKENLLLKERQEKETQEQETQEQETQEQESLKKKSPNKTNANRKTRAMER